MNLKRPSKQPNAAKGNAGVSSNGATVVGVSAMIASEVKTPVATEAMPTPDLSVFASNLCGVSAPVVSVGAAVKAYGAMMNVHSDVLRLLSMVTVDETTGGNCGAFAIALATVLGPAECEYALSSAEWGLDQPTFGHVGVRFRGAIFDGSGLVSDEGLLNRWAEDDDLDAEVRFVRADEGCEAWVLGGTDCSVEPEGFVARLRGCD